MPVTADAARQFARKAREDAEAIQREIDLRFDDIRESRELERMQEETRDFYEEREQ